MLPRGWAEVTLHAESAGRAWALRPSVTIGLPACSIGLSMGLRVSPEVGRDPLELLLRCRVYDREPPRTSVALGLLGRLAEDDSGWGALHIAVRQQAGPTAWTWSLDLGPSIGATRPEFLARAGLDGVLHLGPLAASAGLGLRLGEHPGVDASPLAWWLGGTVLASRGLEVGVRGGADAGGARRAALWLTVRR